MRLLVTGATGFVGSRLALEAVRVGHDVVGIGRNIHAAGAPELTAAGVRLLAGDITDPAFAAVATRGITHVCHLAAAWREASAPADHFHRVNVEGTLTLARAAAANGVVAFVHCSTIGVHARASREAVQENSRIDTTNAYEESKALSEAKLREFARETSMRIAILRPADAYGPGDIRLLKLFSTVKKGRFPLIGAGAGRRHMLFVDDLARAFLATCEANFPSGEAFIIAGPETTTLLALLRKLEKLTGSSRFGFRVPELPMKIAAAVVEDLCRVIHKSPPLHRRTLDFYRTDVVYDTSRAQEVLGWKAQVGLDEGLLRTLDWYRQKSLI